MTSLEDRFDGAVNKHLPKPAIKVRPTKVEITWGDAFKIGFAVAIAPIAIVIILFVLLTLIGSTVTVL